MTVVTICLKALYRTSCKRRMLRARFEIRSGAGRWMQTLGRQKSHLKITVNESVYFINGVDMALSSTVDSVTVAGDAQDNYVILALPGVDGAHVDKVLRVGDKIKIDLAAGEWADFKDGVEPVLACERQRAAMAVSIHAGFAAAAEESAFLLG